MKRLVVIAACLSIFFAGVVWALEGCRGLGDRLNLHHHADQSVADHHDSTHSESHGSHHAKVHCPNVFGEFILSSRVLLNSDRGFTTRASYLTQQLEAFLPDLNSAGLIHGPPGTLVSKILPRHLLFSVMRI